MRHFISLCLAGACLGAPARAAEVALIGVIGNKAAVLALDGGEPKTVKVGQTWGGITVLAVEKDSATVQVEGRKRVLQRGQHYRSAAPGPGAGRQSVTLAADPRGHFIAEGAVNGVPVRMVVDTGASLVTLPGADARRLGLDYLKGRQATMQTANGPASVYVVRLDRVRLGDIELSGVDGVVMESGLPIALLGMSFLNRLEMRREGATMVLTRRF